MGLRFKNGQLMDGAAFDKQFGIAAAASAELSVVLVFESAVEQAGGGQTNYTIVQAWRNSTDAIDTSDFDGFPVESIIWDKQSLKYYYHDTATTWKASAAAS